MSEPIEQQSRGSFGFELRLSLWFGYVAGERADHLAGAR
jgi:hypothetical protein